MTASATAQTLRCDLPPRHAPRPIPAAHAQTAAVSRLRGLEAAGDTVPGVSSTRSGSCSRALFGSTTQGAFRGWTATTFTSDRQVRRIMKGKVRDEVVF